MPDSNVLEGFSEEIPVITKVDSPAPLTQETLLRMVLQLQQQLVETQKNAADAAKAAAEGNKELAAAILESRKPYESESAKKQRQQNIEERHKMIDMQLRQKEATKRVCPHRNSLGKLNIKWHEHSNGITLGVCGLCLSQFDTRNPDDLKLLRDDINAIEKMAHAGVHARRGYGGSVPQVSI